MKNAGWSVVDYLLQPLLVLTATPLLLQKLGPAQYGAWMLVNALTATVAGLGGGFGDATINLVGRYRGRDDHDHVWSVILASLTIAGLLGLTLSLVLVALGPWLLHEFFRVPAPLAQDAAISVRLGAVILLFRMLEGVLAAALRGGERYGPPVLANSASRVGIVTSALAIALAGGGLVAIFCSTLSIAAISLCAQTYILIETFGRPATGLSLEKLQEVSGIGVFTWMKSITSVAFTYGDRLVVGASLGVAPLAYYTICAQLTQPIAGLTGAALHFIFPRLSVEHGCENLQQRIYRSAVRIGGGAAIVLSAPFILFPKLFLKHWLGPTGAEFGSTTLMIMAVGSALLAISVVPHYAALAVGKAKHLALFSAGIGTVSLGACLLLVHFGLTGAAASRLIAGALSLSLFLVVRGTSLSRQTAVVHRYIDGQVSSKPGTVVRAQEPFVS